MSGALVAAGVLPVTPEASPTGAPPADGLWSAAMDQATQANQATQTSQTTQSSQQPPQQAASATTRAASGQVSAPPRHAEKKSDVHARAPHEETSAAASKSKKDDVAEPEQSRIAEVPRHEQKHGSTTVTPAVAGAATNTPVAVQAVQGREAEHHPEHGAEHEAKNGATSKVSGPAVADAAAGTEVAMPTTPTAKPAATPAVTQAAEAAPTDGAPANAGSSAAPAPTRDQKDAPATSVQHAAAATPAVVPAAVSAASTSMPAEAADASDTTDGADGVNGTGGANAPASPSAPISTHAAIAARMQVLNAGTSTKPAQTVTQSLPTQAASATTTTTSTVPVANTLASIAAVGGLPASSQSTAQVATAAAVAVPVPASATADAAGVAASPSALAAAIVAMQRSGNSTATLRLDPPDLGELAVHISLSQSAQVNVQLIPSVPQTAQLLNANLMDLRHAMTAAGLTLGQTQVGGNGAGGQRVPRSGNRARFGAEWRFCDIRRHRWSPRCGRDRCRRRRPGCGPMRNPTRAIQEQGS